MHRRVRMFPRPRTPGMRRLTLANTRPVAWRSCVSAGSIAGDAGRFPFTTSFSDPVLPRCEAGKSPPPNNISVVAENTPAAFSRYQAQNFTLVCTAKGGKPAPSVYFKRDGELIEVISYTQASGEQGGGGSAGVRGARPLISRDLDDTKLQRSLSLLDPEGRAPRLHTESPHQRVHTQGQQAYEPSPATEVIPETVVSREFPRWNNSGFHFDGA
ncbi:Immunoglobulin superfamily member 21 [Liparis tanakae]|nr:Immunoglobulin superfamily member 21 [Liparis tanakae]